MYDFHQLVSVTFKTVAVFTRPKTDVPSDIFLNVPGHGADIGEDARAWSRFTTLGLSDQVRQIEKCLMTLAPANDPANPAALPLRNRKANKHIVLIRHAPMGMLQINGLHMVLMAETEDTRHRTRIGQFDRARKKVNTPNRDR